MSLAAEIAFAEIAAAVGRAGAVWLLSETGVGSPLLESAGPVARIALAPACGFRRRPVCVYSPPATVGAAARLRRDGGRPLLVDATRETAVALLGAAARLRAGPPDAIRVRGGLGGAVPAAGMLRAMTDEEGREEIWLRQDHEPSLSGAIAALERRSGDELDLFVVRAKRSDFIALKHEPWGAEAHFPPIAALDLPDETQIAGALGLMQARFDASGFAGVAIPRLSAASGRFGLEVSGLPAGAPDPAPAAPPPGDWRIGTRRKGDVWRFQAEAMRIRETESLVIALPPEVASAAAISAVWTGAVRGAGGWDAWDEADALLTLEESW